MLRRWLGLVAAGFLLAAFASASAEVAVPPLKARVTDLTGTLTAPQIQTLEARLRDFERGKGSQIAVLILPTPDPGAVRRARLRPVEARPKRYRRRRARPGGERRPAHLDRDRTRRGGTSTR